MGVCVSSSVDPEAVKQNREAEKILREAKAKREIEVKVLLLGSGDSGKSTILKQMRVIHDLKWQPGEMENFRHQVFNNLTFGMKTLLEALEYFEMEVSEENKQYLNMIDQAPDIKDGQPFPIEYLEPLRKLWEDPNVQKGWERANEAALPENLSYFFPQLDRLFVPTYQPNEQDIIRTRTRTVGVQQTMFRLKQHDLMMVDVGGQKSERRKWIHCFQDVTTILFLVSLSGYDQCLVEDKDANQMLDAMTIWDSICHSQWFKHTSIILFLNKEDLFREKIPHSHITNTFPDYEGPPNDVDEGKEYFKKRFLRLSQKSPGKPKEREIYVHFTNATDTEMLRVVMAAVEDIALRGNLEKAALI